MTTSTKWRIAHIANDPKVHDEFVEIFTRAYEANNKPAGMAMYTHNDSLGGVMAVSITPQSVPYCPFSANWSEIANPGNFGAVGWTAGDVRLKP
jgi:hypothetical protein